MSAFDAKDLVDKEREMSEEEKHDPARIAKLIRDAAKQQGIMLKGPDRHCKRCHGRGWIGIDSKTGMPLCCRCIFFKEDLEASNEKVAESDLKPRNRAERRKRKC